MKIIDAFWEKRNLDVDVIEIELDKKDMIDINTSISKITELRSRGKLIYIKAPVGNLELIHALEDLGFRFLECQLKISKNIEEYTPPTSIKSLLENTRAQIIEKNNYELQKLLKNITLGMFCTDRIFLDPLWGDSNKKLSAVRYKNWIKDIFFNEDIISYYILHHNNKVGFGVSKIDKDRGYVYLLLGGAFRDRQDPIAGVAFINAPLALFSENSKKIETAISANNLAACKLYSEFGYKINKVVYVLRILS